MAQLSTIPSDTSQDGTLVEAIERLKERREEATGQLAEMEVQWSRYDTSYG